MICLVTCLFYIRQGIFSIKNMYLVFIGKGSSEVVLSFHVPLCLHNQYKTLPTLLESY